MAWTDPITHSVGFFVDAPDWNDEITENNKCQVAPASATIADLNTLWGSPPPDGAEGRLKVGTAPYTIVTLYYSDDLTAWVTAEEWVPLQSAAWSTTGQTLATEVPIGTLAYTTPRPWKVMSDAGLQPQLKVLGALRSQATGSSTSNYAAPAAWGANVGGNAPQSNLQSAADAGKVASIAYADVALIEGPWGALNSGFTVYDYLTPTVVMSQTGTGTGNFWAEHAVCGLRWVG